MSHDYCLIEVCISFSFFVLTSGRPLPGITFFVLKFEATLQPLCSADRDSGIFCTAATALFIAVKGLSLQRETAIFCYCCSQPCLYAKCCTFTVADPREGPRPPALPLIFRSEKILFATSHPLFQGLDDCPHPPYPKVWICHCYRCDFSTKIPPSHNTGLNWLIAMYAFSKTTRKGKSLR